MAIGRGLGALLGPTAGRKKITLETGSANTQHKVWVVPVSEIFPNAKQPRKHFGTTEINELAESVREHGILQPLLVAEKSDGGYELVAGERRLRAAKLAGLASVPVLVKTMADREKLEVALIENIQRQDLNPIEEAFAYKRLMEEFGLTQENVATTVGKSRPAVANTVRLLELPAEVQKALIEKKISTGQARALLGLVNKKEQLEMLASLLGEKITVRELEHTMQGRRATSKNRRDPNTAYVEDQLRSALGTKVSVSGKGGKGTVSISYFSPEELAKLVRRILGA